MVKHADEVPNLLPELFEGAGNMMVEVPASGVDLDEQRPDSPVVLENTIADRQ
jgi:hypothetical protein